MLLHHDKIKTRLFRQILFILLMISSLRLKYIIILNIKYLNKKIYVIIKPILHKIVELYPMKDVKRSFKIFIISLTRYFMCP